MVILPRTYDSAVSGLCGTGNRQDDSLLSDGERTQNTLELAHSWRTGGAAGPPVAPVSWGAAKSRTTKLFETSDFL